MRVPSGNYYDIVHIRHIEHIHVRRCHGATSTWGRIIDVNIVSMTKISIGNPGSEEERREQTRGFVIIIIIIHGTANNDVDGHGGNMKNRFLTSQSFGVKLFFRTRFQLFLCFLVILHRTTQRAWHAEAFWESYCVRRAVYPFPIYFVCETFSRILKIIWKERRKHWNS